MPRVDWNSESTWQQFYGATVNGVRVSYGRAWAYMEDEGFTPEESGVARRRDLLITAMPGLTATHRILIGGSGFGFLIDRFRAAGYTNCWGVDSSSHIESRKGVEAVNSTLWVADTITGGGRVRTALRNLTGANTFDWIITESVLESYNDLELPQIFSACEAVLANGRPLSSIVHFVFVPPFNGAPGVFNEKPIDVWKLLRPTHTWVSDLGEVR